MIDTAERFDAKEYAARAKALRDKFYSPRSQAVTPREQPRIVEITRPTYDSVRRISAVMKPGVFGPFPLDPVYRPHAAYDAAVVAVHTRSEPKAIIARVAAGHGVSIETMIGRRRDSQAVNARHHAMAKVYVECPHLSLPQIARLFQRDHTSLLHAVKRLGVWRGAAS